MAVGSPYTSVGGTSTGGNPSYNPTSAANSRGGKGSAFGKGTSSVSSTEKNTTKDTTTTKNKGDVTTTNTTDTDVNAQKNLLANVRGSIQSLIAAQQGAEDLYEQNLATNQAVANQQTLENNRNANNNWYLNQQKLQNVRSRLGSNIGNGQYGSAEATLDYLTRVYDDMADQNLLNNQRQQQNEIYQDLFSSNSNAANDYNESLLSNQQELMDQVYAYLADYNNYLGNKTVQRNKTNETNKSTTKGNTTTKSTTTSKNRGNKQGNTITSSVVSTNNVTNTNTGNNTVRNNTDTYLSPYLKKNGDLDYKKIGKALGISLTKSGSVNLGDRVVAPKLQQQNNYRSPRDTVAALTRRYG